MSSGFLRKVRALVVVLLILGLAGSLIGYAWYSVNQTTETRRNEAIEQANAIVTGIAGSYAEQINRQILALDQTLDMMARELEADPRQFNLEISRARSQVISGISRDMFLADQNGVIRQSSVSDFLGQSVADLDVFRAAAEHANDKPKLYIGGAAVNPIMRQWHLDAARTLHNPDGSFGGIIDADYRVSAINDVFASGGLPASGFAAIIGLVDGKLRATQGPVPTTPDANIADTPMFAAVDGAESGSWVGPSAPDTIERIHAFRRIPGRDLAIIAGLDRQEVLNPVMVWQRQMRMFAAALTGLTTVLTVVLLMSLRGRRRRGVAAREMRARFASANALAEVSRAHADAIARRLEATLAAVADGVAIFDAHLNLVEWNELFPQRSGVNLSFIHTGMPMEDVLRTQAQSGYFGEGADVEGEVERRTALLRAGNFGASQSFQTAGRSIDLRCRPLPEGGFVALYSDVTEGRRARQALRDAHDALRREQSARMRFLNVISKEMRTRVVTLMQSVARVKVAADDEVDLGRVRRVGQDLADLATDTIEVPVMESGSLALRPELLDVRALLRDIVDTIQPAAADRGITMYLIVNDTAPAELIADPGRIRQIVTLLMSEAFRFATPDTMWLLADGGDDETRDTVALRLTIRGFGQPIAEPTRNGLFRSLEAVTVPDTDVISRRTANISGSDSGATMPDARAGATIPDARAGATIPDARAGGETGLRPAIARHLTAVMGGQVRCEGWSTLDGRTGNDFIMTLPPDLLPGQRGRAPGQISPEGRPLPRTRVMLVGARTGLRQAAVTMLRRDGHMVDAVDTAAEALAWLRNAPFDVVFMDSVLPDGPAETLLNTMRDESGPARTVPVVVLAPPHEEIEERAWRDAGADEVLPRNPTLHELTGALRGAVWLSRSSGAGLGFMPGFAGETEEGIPILAADRIAELRANIPLDELTDMIEECIADLFHRLPALRRALALEAIGAITAQTHAMVGMAGGYGMAVLEARLRAILTAVRGRRLDTIDGAAEVVEADLTRAAAALRRTFGLAQPADANARS